MNDRSHDGLNYGHFGEIGYDRGLQRWIASRRAAAFGPLTPLEREDSHRNRKLESSHKHSSESGRSFQTNELIKDYPVLQPAASIIHSLHTEAAKEGKESESWNGDRLAIVRVDTAQRRHGRGGGVEQLLVLVLPGGAFGEEVRFHELQMTQMGWDNNKALWLEVPKISENSLVAWKGDGGPIRQICPLEDAENLSSMIAIRTPTSIHVVQLLFHQAATSVSLILEAHTLLTLRAIRKTSAEYIDIASNPWDRCQIAAIDTEGSWLVWECSLNTKIQAQVLTQSIHDDHSIDRNEDDDGRWYRILWVSDEYHIVICNRSSLEVFEIGKGSVTLWQPNRFSIGTHIIDCKRSHQSLDHVFLLTSTHLILLKIHTENDVPPVEVTSSWQHYRDPGDISMRLTLHHIANGESVLLYSAQVALVTEYRFLVGLEGRVSMSILDPSRFQWHGTALLGLAVIPVAQSCEQGPSSQEMGEPFDGQENHFAQIIGLQTGRDAISSLCYIGDISRKEQSSLRQPTWEKGQKRMQLSSARVKDDEFIIDDGEEISEDDGEEDSLAKRSLSARSGQVLTQKFTLPYELVYSRLAKQTSETLTDFVTLMDKVKRDDSAAHRQVLSMLESMERNELEVNSLDAAVLAAKEFENSFESVLYRSSLRSLLGTKTSSNSTFSIESIYSGIVNNWIRPLDAAVRGPARLALERISRRTAASIYIASHGIRPPILALDEQAGQDESLGTVRYEVPDVTTNSAPMNQTSAAEAATRLGRIVKIAQPPMVTTDLTSKLVRQWQLNIDPSSIKYKPISAALDGEGSTEGSQLSAADRGRLDSQNERRRKRTEEKRMLIEDSQKRRALVSSMSGGQIIHGPAYNQPQMSSRPWQHSSQPRGPLGLDSQGDPGPPPGPSSTIDAQSHSQSQTQTQTQASQQLAFASQTESVRHGGLNFAHRQRKVRKSGF